MGNKYRSLAEQWGVEPRRGERRKANNTQLTLDMAKTACGGRREGAGRPKSPRSKVPHRTRDADMSGTPVHITLGRLPDLPGFRFPTLHDEIVRCIVASPHDDFRIVHYSVQSDHIHLIVEADGPALGRGMRNFSIRVAQGLNRNVLDRRGKVWADRPHRHPLRTPREVRNALVYVLANGVKHGVVPAGCIDPCSSGPYFTRWNTPIAIPANEVPVRPPQTWLLAKSWVGIRPGYISLAEIPRAARKLSDA